LPTLHVLQGPDKGRTYDTPNESIVIGRSSEQVHLSDQSASRRHAEIRPSNGHWILLDLNSSNGTYLNGQRVVSPMPLKHGDQIKVGSSLLVFHGREGVEGVSSVHRLQDLVDLDASGALGGSSILSSMDASEESVIIQPPETADAVAAWNVVYKVAETLGTTESVDAFLERVVDILFGHLIVDRMILMLHDPETKNLVPRLVRYRTRDRGRQPKLVTSRKIINHVLETRDGVLCANAMTDDRFGGDDLGDSIHRFGLRSIICVPVVAHGEVHGVLHLDCSMSYHTYTHEQLRLVIAIGRLVGMAIENFRLTESRMKTERLAAAGEAVAYLSHYIRNVLQGMQSGAEVLELGLKRENLDTLRSGWHLMRRNLDRIYLLAMNMLTFSKDRQPRIEAAHLNKIIEDVISLAQGRADEKGVMLLPELEDIPAVPMDPDGVHQVAHNIILNAIEAVDESTGRVNIRTHYDNTSGQVILFISDNGPGIAPEDQQRIFDAFHSSKGQGGTGLGLAAARKIVDELEGRIEIDSTPNEGTTFRVILPASHVKLADSDRTLGPSAH
jgi:two-component system, NtrC family, sensor kinase